MYEKNTQTEAPPENSPTLEEKIMSPKSGTQITIL